VIGCGIVGLTTARLLQRHGFDVEIHAAELPPKTTSNIAGAQWSPASVYDREALRPAFARQLERALGLSYRYFQEQVGTRYGVRWVSNYLLSDTPFDPERDFRSDYPELYPEAVDLAPAEHPFPVPHARHFDTMFMEPPHYLPVIEEEFRQAGGRIVRRHFADLDEVTGLGFPVVVNCTGLGAGALVGDPELMPIKGQLTVLLPQEEVDYLVIHDGRYMFPRADGILLGGTHERGEWSLAVNEEAKARIVAGHRDFFDAMDDPASRRTVVG
jgi:glycine/D-amino acid oxidase-like deaminating enzyme